jgi:hypothetical protein
MGVCVSVSDEPPGLSGSLWPLIKVEAIDGHAKVFSASANYTAFENISNAGRGSAKSVAVISRGKIEKG